MTCFSAWRTVHKLTATVMIRLYKMNMYKNIASSRELNPTQLKQKHLFPFFISLGDCNIFIQVQIRLVGIHSNSLKYTVRFCKIFIQISPRLRTSSTV